MGLTTRINIYLLGDAVCSEVEGESIEVEEAKKIAASLFNTPQVEDADTDEQQNDICTKEQGAESKLTRREEGSIVVVSDEDEGESVKSREKKSQSFCDDNADPKATMNFNKDVPITIIQRPRPERPFVKPRKKYVDIRPVPASITPNTVIRPTGPTPNRPGPKRTTQIYNTSP